MAIRSPRPVDAPGVRQRLSWRLAVTLLTLVVVGTLVGAGVGYVLAQGIDALLPASGASGW